MDVCRNDAPETAGGHIDWDEELGGGAMARFEMELAVIARALRRVPVCLEADNVAERLLLRGLIDEQTGYRRTAIENYRRAAELFAAADDRRAELGARFLLAKALYGYGGWPAAWRECLRCWRLAQRHGSRADRRRVMRLLASNRIRDHHTTSHRLAGGHRQRSHPSITGGGN